MSDEREKKEKEKKRKKREKKDRKGYPQNFSFFLGIFFPKKPDEINSQISG